jgi:hypothetical protein
LFEFFWDFDGDFTFGFSGFFAGSGDDSLSSVSSSFAEETAFTLLLPLGLLSVFGDLPLDFDATLGVSCLDLLPPLDVSSVSLVFALDLGVISDALLEDLESLLFPPLFSTDLPILFTVLSFDLLSVLLLSFCLL